MRSTERLKATNEKKEIKEKKRSDIILPITTLDNNVQRQQENIEARNNVLDNEDLARLITQYLNNSDIVSALLSGKVFGINKMIFTEMVNIKNVVIDMKNGNYEHLFINYADEFKKFCVYRDQLTPYLKKLTLTQKMF